MAGTPESLVKAECVKILKKYHAYYFFAVTSGYGHSGVLDITTCFRGYFLAIECKAGKGKMTKLQEMERDKVLAAGGEVLEIREDNIHELEDWFKRRSKCNIR